ncbi:MAG: hypothetical protein JSW11_00800 [Candidatus Heimdallarchaeota archaeon]|nr:MAG: hypothetical protein JSW11_00800 [Candidatus Heimdallarchaeota archaeon]
MSNQEMLSGKLEALVNKYGGDLEIINHLDELPKTIKKFIYGSEKLMIRFGLVCKIEIYIDTGENI